jgi:hypothetical protein
MMLPKIALSLFALLYVFPLSIAALLHQVTDIGAD